MLPQGPAEPCADPKGRLEGSDALTVPIHPGSRRAARQDPLVTPTALSGRSRSSELLDARGLRHHKAKQAAQSHRP